MAYSIGSNRLEITRSVGIGWRNAPGLRIALATDMHAPHDYIDALEFNEAIGAFDPHLFLIVGDAIERRGNEALVRFYADAPARLGKFASLGNWEYYGGISHDTLAREYERAGARLLINERTRIEYEGRPVDIVGLDDLLGSRPDYGLLRPSLRDAPDTPLIVLSHCPATFDKIVPAAGRHAHVMAGHTHGGQVAPLGWAPVRPYGSGRYVSGWYGDRDGSVLYVSRGLGNSGVPFRIGARPELALITL